MKKLLAAVALFLATTLSFAQEETQAPVKKDSRFGAGIKFGMGYGFMYGFEEEDDDVDESPSGMTYEAGVMLRIQLVENFAFVPEFNFGYIKTDHSYLNMKRTYARTDLEIPMLLRGTVAKRFYVTFGPQLNINLDNENKIKDADSNVDMGIVENLEQSTIDFGIAAGAGVNIVDKLFFDIRAYMGLMELFPDVLYAFDDNLDVDFDKTKNWSMINMAGAKMFKIKAGLSYWFI